MNIIKYFNIPKLSHIADINRKKVFIFRLPEPEAFNIILQVKILFLSFIF